MGFFIFASDCITAAPISQICQYYKLLLCLLWITFFGGLVQYAYTCVPALHI